MDLKTSLVAALCMVTASACETAHKDVSPDLRAQMMRELQTGDVNLACTLSCMFSWAQGVPHLQALDISENWPDLAVGVMQIGFRGDLAYYYLGQAAQGLGYHEAAIKLYRVSAAISSGDFQGQLAIQCEPSDTCQGIDLQSVLPTLIQASVDALN